MAIVQTIDSFSDFYSAFGQYNRLNDFTYDGLRILFDYLNDTSDDTGEDLQLDVIALCCDYSENTIEELIYNYSEIDVSECESEEERKEKVREFLEDNTTIAGETDSGFLFVSF